MTTKTQEKRKCFSGVTLWLCSIWNIQHEHTTERIWKWLLFSFDIFRRIWCLRDCGRGLIRISLMAYHNLPTIWRNILTIYSPWVKDRAASKVFLWSLSVAVLCLGDIHFVKRILRWSRWPIRLLVWQKLNNQSSGKFRISFT